MLIPRVFHQVWLGDKPRPHAFVRWSEAWKTLHPTWKVRLWQQDGDGCVGSGNHKFKSRYPELLARACHLSQRSNILRYELVEHFGGIYLDTDMEPLQPIDSRSATPGSEAIVERVAAFAPLMNVFRDGRPQTCLGCAIFGAVPGHPWTRDLVAGLKGIDPAVNGSAGSKYFARVTSGHPEVTVFEPHVFYTEGYRPSGRRPSNDAMTRHHWSGRWWEGSFKPLGSRATT